MKSSNEPPTKKLLFLYTELAGYVVACLNKLCSDHDCEVHLVRWPVNKEAPFDFLFSGHIRIYDRKDHSASSLLELASIIDPDLVYCSGWVDKDYLAVCRKYRSKVPVVVGFDNRWKGSLKQAFASLSSPFTVQRCFSHAWIPGTPQEKFANKLGFKGSNLISGFYSADTDLFHSQYLQHKEAKRRNFPRRFIYAARYYRFKGIVDLWKAFAELCSEKDNGWELWCLGTGDVAPLEHPRIRHFGFVQPFDMEPILADTGVFVLPSHVEPWGVAVHEFAAAGYPLICSDQVGAASAFLQVGRNGYSFKAGDKESLKKALRRITEHTNDELAAMGTASSALAQTITPAGWAKTLMSIVYKIAN